MEVRRWCLVREHHAQGDQAPAPTEFVYFHTVTAKLQRRKRAEERVQQLQSKATAAWDRCILLMQEVGDMGETAQHKNIITEGTGGTAISMPSSFTSYILRDDTQNSRDTCSAF